MKIFNHPESDSYISVKSPEGSVYEYDGGLHEISPSDIPAGAQVSVGDRMSTVYPDMDFETYSEAGYNWDPDGGKYGKWVSISPSPPHGLGAVGASAYSEHPSTEVLILAYNLKDGTGPKFWVPGLPPPQDLFDHLAKGALIEAHNSAFEYYIWHNVCVPKLGWPPIPFWQLRDSMAKARAHSFPAALKNLAKVTNAPDKKIDDGMRLINKFCKPRNPTKNDPRRRIRPEEDHIDGPLLYQYCLGDIRSESAVSALIPDLSARELELWLLDQHINFTGVYIDGEGLSNCIEVFNQAHVKYSAELYALTGGAVDSPTKLKPMTEWLGANGLHMSSLDKEHIADALSKFKTDEEIKAENIGERSLNPLNPRVTEGLDALPNARIIRRVLEIRSSLGAASVKKLFSIDRRRSADGYLRDLFAFCGADRTGRFAGRGPQPQNLPNSGPKVMQCGECNRHYGRHVDVCPWCSAPGWASSAVDWCVEAVEDAFEVMKYRRLDIVEKVFGDAVATIAGCLRGLFSAAPGMELISSDYSAIEAVVLAMLSGEQWRIDVFNTHGKIYEMSASKITGVPFEEMMAGAGYTDLSAPKWWEAKQTGEHHPSRKKIGKVSELASGFGGGKGAWCAFGADKFMSDDEIKAAVEAWRAASPMIPKLWYGLQGAAEKAIQNPGYRYEYRLFTYWMDRENDILYCELPSGRRLTYHEPRLTVIMKWGRETLQMSYMGWNSDYTKGPMGWTRLETWGGKLTENVCQAVARDLMTFAMPSIERAGYHICMHIHDELVSHVKIGFGSIEEFERIMATVPNWAADWPIRAAGGWRGQRYRKG